MERVANSTPMVDFESRLNSLRVKRLSRLDFPTPESPIRTTVVEHTDQYRLHLGHNGPGVWVMEGDGYL